jgi:lipopolysaccharide transport system ATP-binding protein
MSDIAISVNNVSKCYRVFDDPRSRLLHAVLPMHTKGMQEVWALKDINFEVKRGESVAIIGRNGGGKSTLLEILTGTLSPTSGSAVVNGRISALLELGSGFNPEYSGRDNVILNGLLLGLSKDDILSRFSEIEAFAEIGAAIDRPVKTYSSGMMMRLAFAVQVLCDPVILIIDEALSVGDFFFQQKCLSYMRGLCAKGVTLLFVSHDMGMVRDLCERGIFLNKGSVVFDGDKLEAIRRYLQLDNSTPGFPARAAVAVANKHSDIISSTFIEQPFWTLDGDGVKEKRDREAYIIAIGISDEEGQPITSARMGGEATINVHYRSFCLEPVHVHLVIKNKYDHIVTAVGSHNLKVIPPNLAIGQDVVFKLDIQMSLEAGLYALCFSLTRPTADGTTGVLIDETPWLGPFQLHWDYSAEIPPFFGLAGMNSKGRFLQ